MIALRLRTLLLFGLAIFGLTFAGGMTFNALAHGGDETAVHACVSDSSGVPRIVDANDDCRNRETPLDLVSGDAAGLSGVETVSAVVSLPDTRQKIVTQSVSCPVGKVATGGSFKLLDAYGVTPGATLVSDFPIGNPPTGWQAIANTQIRFGTTTPPLSLEVIVICATASP